MGVTEQQRHTLLTWFEEQMGPERAATMMELMPPAGAAELATKRDLDDLERRLDARFDELDARFDAKLEVMRSTTLRTVGTWLFASQAAVITAIGVAAGVIVRAGLTASNTRGPPWPASRGARAMSGGVEPEVGGSGGRSDRIDEGDRVLAAGSHSRPVHQHDLLPVALGHDAGQGTLGEGHQCGRALVAVPQLERHAERGGGLVELRSALQAAVGDVAERAAAASEQVADHVGQLTEERAVGVVHADEPLDPLHPRSLVALTPGRTSFHSSDVASGRRGAAVGAQLVKDQIVTVPDTSLPTRSSGTPVELSSTRDQGQALGAVVGR